MSTKVDMVSATGMRRFTVVAAIALALWIVMIAAGIALL